jgi:hypothetical protein
MNRLILVSVGLSLTLPIAAFAQVKISISGQDFRLQDEIHAKVENKESRAVTFCVEFGQTSPKGAEIESTPSPFWIQRESNGTWGTLIIGPDVGSIRAAVVLEAGESKDFPLRLNDSGRMRLRLNYWRGSTSNLDCNTPPKGSKLATSPIFTIRREDMQWRDDRGQLEEPF